MGNMPTVEQLTAEIRAELRSIVRQWDELRQPFTRYTEIKGIPQGQPRWRLDQAKTHEATHDDLYRFAGSVWQLKDRLKDWAKVAGIRFSKPGPHGTQIPTDIEGIAKESTPLLLCADLFNFKKHGELSSPRTPYRPIFSGLGWANPKGHEAQALRIDGATKQHEFLYHEPVPRPWRCEIISAKQDWNFGHAVVVIALAMQPWIHVLMQSDILKPRSDREVAHIIEGRNRLAEYAAKTDPHAPLVPDDAAAL